MAEAAGAVFLQIGRCEVQGLGELLSIDRQIVRLDRGIGHSGIIGPRPAS